MHGGPAFAAARRPCRRLGRTFFVRLGERGVRFGFSETGFAARWFPHACLVCRSSGSVLRISASAKQAVQLVGFAMPVSFAVHQGMFSVYLLQRSRRCSSLLSPFMSLLRVLQGEFSVCLPQRACREGR